MIQLTRLNRGPFVLNADLIEHVETTPDTVITLTNGHQFVVREPADEVVARVVRYRRRLNEFWSGHPESMPSGVNDLPEVG